MVLQDTDDVYSPKNVDPKGAPSLENAEPKGATSLKKHPIAHAESPIGASSGKNPEHHDGEPKGANYSDAMETAEPKGATSLKIKPIAQSERTIGDSAGQISGLQEGEPKGGNYSYTKETAEPKGASTKRTHIHAQADTPMGASAALSPGHQEGYPKGANNTYSKETAEPKGATTQKSTSNAHEERPIGASAARFQVHKEGEPTGAITPDSKNLEEPKGASSKETTTMAEEGAGQIRDARGNVAAGEGALGSAEVSATDPRRTHTYGQGHHVYGKVIAADRKEQRVVPIRKTKGANDLEKKVKTAKGAKLLYPLGTTAKGEKGVRQLPAERQTVLKSKDVDLATNPKTAKGEKGLRHYPVASKSSNGLALTTKPRSNFPPCKSAYGEKGEEQFPVDNESMQKRIGDELATKLKGPAKPNLDPKNVCNSDGQNVSDISLPTWSPLLMVKGSGIASPNVNVPNSNTANGAKGKDQLPVDNEFVPTGTRDHLATKLEGLAMPIWDPQQDSKSDGPECHLGLNWIISEISLPTWSSMLPLKG